MTEGSDNSNLRRPRAGGSGATARRSVAGEDGDNGIEGEWPRRWWASTYYRSQEWLSPKASARV